MGGRGIEEDGLGAAGFASAVGGGVGSDGLGRAGDEGGGSLAPEILALAPDAGVVTGAA